MIPQRRNTSQKIPRASGRSDKFDDFPLLTARKPHLTSEQSYLDGSQTKFADLRRNSKVDGLPRRGASHSPKPPSARRRIGSKRVKQPLRSKPVDNGHDDLMSEQNAESISDLTNLFSDNVFVNDERQNLSFSSDYSNRRERLNSSFSSDASRMRFDRQNSSFSSDASNMHYARLQNSFSSTGSYRNVQHGIEGEGTFSEMPFFEHFSNLEALPQPPGRLRVSSRDTPSKRGLLRQVSAGTSSSRDVSRSTLMTNRSSSESRSSLCSNDFDQDCLPQRCLSRSNSSVVADRTSKYASESNTNKTARRSRRPKASCNNSFPERQQTSFHGAVEDLPVRQSKNCREEFMNSKKKDDYLNRSFNLSFGSVNDPSYFVRNEETGNDATILTPSLNLKPFLSSVLNFEFPSESLKDSRRAIPPEDVIQPIRDAISIVDEEESLALDEVSEAKLTLYEYARRYEWDMVLEECKHSPWTAKFVSSNDGTTALHLAVMSRANPQIRDGAQEGLKAASLQLIEQLIIACPESAIIRCTLKKYTPLCFACLVTDKGYDMEDSAKMIRIILKHSPHSALVFTDESFSALDVHIISYSRLFQEKEEIQSRNGRSSTVVLRTLLKASPSLALSRSYGNRVRGPVELLYRCNLNEFKEASGQEIAVFGKHNKNSAACSVLSSLSQWWAWKWTLMLLEVASKFEGFDAIIEEETTIFLAVHAAAQLEGCPVPILALAMDAFPDQVKMRNPTKGLNNCPLHYVCGWVSDALCINGDPVIVKRKRKAIALLLEAFPKAARMTNSLGETPLHLAIETCSPWETLEDLVRMFPAALTIPRNINNCREESPLFKAMAYHNDDLGSVGSDEWEPDAIESIQGMYPFMIAAVLSHVPDRRMKGSSIILDYSKRRDSGGKGLQEKDLESLRSIYGLLRAKPLALELFRGDERNRTLLDIGDKEDKRDDTDENTEAFREDENFSEYTEEDVSIEIHSEYTEEEVE
jgi:hypothetical protein